MTKEGEKGRTDTASRLLKASPQTVYQALLDPDALAKWLPPDGMRAEIYSFEPKKGGAYRMALIYETADHRTPGKTSENADVIEGCFLELIANERVVQQVEFASDDPAFAGMMTITWSLAPSAEGTLVTVECENVPSGISQKDHEIGLRSTIANLAAFVE